jgi:hypothetical protein
LRANAGTVANHIGSTAVLEYGPTEIFPPVGAMSPRRARLCRPRRLPHPARPREKPGFSTWEGEIPRDTEATQIEWTNATWNPVTGCSKITAGCDFCYAERLSERFRGVTGHPFENGFDLTLRPARLKQPMQWRRARRIFVNSMSDLFHKELPVKFIDSVFDAMEEADWHIYEVLTKRSSPAVAKFNRPDEGFAIKTFHGEFVDAVDEVRKFVGQAFALISIDPTGWTEYPFAKIAPLFAPSKCEALINFMYGHISRIKDLKTAFRVMIALMNFALSSRWASEWL